MADGRTWDLSVGFVVVCLFGSVACSSLSRQTRDSETEEIVVVPRELMVREGSPADFYCYGPPGSDLQWYRKNKRITPRRGRISVENKNEGTGWAWSHFRIESSSEKTHKKKYTCVVTSPSGKVTKVTSKLTFYSGRGDNVIPRDLQVAYFQRYSSLNLSWALETPASSKQQEFEVFFTEENFTAVYHRIVPAVSGLDRQSVVINDLEPGTTYTFRVRYRSKKAWPFSQAVQFTTLDDSQCVDADGRAVADGNRGLPNEDPCFTCSCIRGDWVHCMTPMCKPNCPNFVIIPGTCCQYNCTQPAPLETGCSDRNGQMVEEGSRYQPEVDPCVTCECWEGQAKRCLTVACYIPCRNYTLDENSCCNFTCIEEKTPAPSQGTLCIDRMGLEVRVGEVFEPEYCMQCECLPGGVPGNCSEVVCDAPECPHYRLIPGTCCGFVCLDGPDKTTGAGCVDRRGIAVTVGEVFEAEPCVMCECLPGNITGYCNSIICDEPPCPNYRLIPDTCCGFECIDNQTESGCVDRKGRKVPNQAEYQPESDPCVQCTCHEGFPVQCMSVACFISCKNFTVHPDSCCNVTCHSDTANDLVEVFGELDVRQIGPSLAMVQWYMQAEVTAVDVVWREESGNQFWNLSADQDHVILRNLEFGKAYKVKARGFVKSENRSIETETVTFSLRHRLSYTLPVADLRGMIFTDGEIYPQRERALEFLNLGAYIRVDAAPGREDHCLHQGTGPAPPTASFSDCGSIYVHGVDRYVNRFRFTNKMDFHWALAHL